MNTSLATKNEEVKENKRKERMNPTVLIIICAIASVAVFFFSLWAGASNITFRTVLAALFQYNETVPQHYTIFEMRFPRTIMAFLLGAAFAVSGAIMQGVMRNPLASPGLMGVTAGASFAIVVAFAFYPHMGYHQLILFSMVGSAIGTVIVYAVGTLASYSIMGSHRYVTFALAGAAVGAMFGALTKGIEIYFGVMTNVMYWYSAGVAGVKWFEVQVVLPWIITGLILSIFISRSLSILSLGEEVAGGLGQNVKVIKAFAALIVFILVGSAVSICGPIGFIGLIIPHITRYLIGVDYRWVIPCSAILGGLLLAGADAMARLVNPPFETPVGVITSLIGVPFFLYLARKGGKFSL